MGHRRVSGHRTPTVAILAYSLVAGAFAAALSLGGCGGDEADQVLARIDGEKITWGDYVGYLKRLEPGTELRTVTNEPIDTTTPAGRCALVEYLVDRRVLVDRAEDLGLRTDADVESAKAYLTEFYGVMAQYRDRVEEGTEFVSNEEIDEYYGLLQQARLCRIMVIDRLADARKARQRILDGDLWADVAREYHVGPVMSRSDPYLTRFQYGYLDDAFEAAIYSLKPGEVSEPVETSYGYWLIRLERIDRARVAPQEEIAGEAAVAIRKRNVKLRQLEFLAQLHEKYQFELDQDVLWRIYQALPQNQPERDETGRPLPGASLAPLAVGPEDFDLVICRYVVDGVPTTYTVGDFKSSYDGMSGVARPKRSKPFGELRRRIEHTIDRNLLAIEAQSSGYMTEPEVQRTVAQRIDDMLIDRLIDKYIAFDENVKPAAIDSFYALHGAELMTLEQREGRVVYCEDRRSAASARESALAGDDWLDILDRFGTNAENRERQGKIANAGITTVDPASAALRSLAKPGAVSEVIPAGSAWAVVRLDRVETPRPLRREEASSRIAEHLVGLRRNEAIRAAVTRWRREHRIEVSTDRCDDLPSRAELEQPAVG